MVSGNLTLEQIEQLAAQLSAQEQLRLLANISQRLSDTVVKPPRGDEDETRRRDEKLQLVKDLLAECSGITDDANGTSDAAEIIRRMRDQRMARLWQNGA